MYCSKCGKKSNSATNSCTDCGNKLRKIKRLYEDIYEGIQLKPKKLSCFLYVFLFLCLVIFTYFVLFFVESNVDTSLPVIYHYRDKTTPINTFVLLFFTRITCWIVILSGIWASAHCIKLTIKNKPIIIVNQNGISTFYSKRPYFISWDNIENIDIHISYTRGRAFKIKNVQIYFKQPLKKHSRGYISLALTGIKYEDFLQQVLEYKELIGK